MFPLPAVLPKLLRSPPPHGHYQWRGATCGGGRMEESAAWRCAVAREELYRGRASGGDSQPHVAGVGSRGEARAGLFRRAFQSGWIFAAVVE